MHLVAPPGSGKTILGLEVMLRINKPTMVFVPTNSIKQQWIQKFCEQFLNQNNSPDWISDDIKNPKFLTVTTYQGLNAVLTNNSEFFYKQIKKLGIEVLVLDEAHHLKNVWWKSLMEVKTFLQPTIVGLTATPPFDVSFSEWNKYETLNGKIDSVISIPELVIENNLCPHQDYIHFSLPTTQEVESIEKSKSKVLKLYNDIQEDLNFILAIENHPFFHQPKDVLEKVYAKIERYTAVLVFLKHIGLEITKEHVEILGDKSIKIPKLSYEWIEILLTFYLFEEDEYFQEYEEHKETLFNKLKRAGVLEHKTIDFYRNKSVNKTLSSSINKLESIEKIVEFEYAQLNHRLRMVILSDYIRKEFLVDKNINSAPLDKLGVIPIFEYIRRGNLQGVKLGVLTGSVVIIPKSSFEIFKEIMLAKGITNVSAKELVYDKNYIEISAREQSKNFIVYVITEMFQSGYIEVLIGTKALLGEGWDAPAINSLVLASFVGSYVQSNQMRGRAIRATLDNKDKTGNIWHLVSLDKSSASGGSDMELLKRRFKSFVGVHLSKEEGIENGVSRLQFAEKVNELDVASLNKNMFKSAANRVALIDKWQSAVDKGESLVEEYKIPLPRNKHEKQEDEDFDFEETKQFHYNKTVRNALVTFGFGALTFGVESVFIEVAQNLSNYKLLSTAIFLFGLVGIGSFAYKTFKTLRIYLGYRDVSKDIEGIAKALLNTLIEMKVVENNSDLEIITEVDKKGAVYCHLRGAISFEKTIFINCLEEIISPVVSPRYLIVRKHSINKFIHQKDYHAVPDIIGKNKMNALVFEKQWRIHVGYCDLIFTSTIEGRRLLLKSRIKSLSARLDNSKKHKSEKIYRWR